MKSGCLRWLSAIGSETMALPALDNHDGRIRFYELMLQADITGMAEILMLQICGLKQ